MKHYLAVDLGAESGRAILGTISGGRLQLEELHRFLNSPVRIPTGFYWDTFRLWHEIQQGAAVAGRERKLRIEGIGVDTWGVDFALLSADGALADNPRHYRDSRNNGMVEAICAAAPREEIFAHTGIQFMQLNTLCQLYAMKLANAPALQTAAKLLFMPDLFNYWLTGVAKAEVTIASTSQMYDPARKRWATELLDRLGLPVALLPEIAPSGARLGEIRTEVAETTGLEPGTPVYTTGCHDTASAVAAAPAEGDDWCYISSGTWSLMGVELDEPVINSASLAQNLTNEVGVGDKIRLLKNISGLWLLQECRRAWRAAGRDYSYAELTELAARATPFRAIIHPDVFITPGRLPERIAAYCEATGQRAPEGPGEMCRAILESLAFRYRQVLEGLEALLGRAIRVIHIVGGGSQNHVLNQFVADATSRPVTAGPTEATAAGNVLVQAVGAGILSGLAEARSIVKTSFPLRHFEPEHNEGWDAAYRAFTALPQREGGF
ncbi:MAG: rhamnulokinase [Bryobacteraceae bacterium]|nr:rhamnulokinase [Bryobacteraceae bacterium]